MSRSPAVLFEIENTIYASLITSKYIFLIYPKHLQVFPGLLSSPTFIPGIWCAPGRPTRPDGASAIAAELGGIPGGIGIAGCGGMPGSAGWPPAPGCSALAPCCPCICCCKHKARHMWRQVMNNEDNYYFIRKGENVMNQAHWGGECSDLSAVGGMCYFIHRGSNVIFHPQWEECNISSTVGGM